MKTKKTAVEWLIEQLIELDKQLDGRRNSDDSTVIKLNPTRIYEQAKQMEKEQIKSAFIEGYHYENLDFENSDKFANLHYTITYGK